MVDFYAKCEYLWARSKFFNWGFYNKFSVHYIRKLGDQHLAGSKVFNRFKIMWFLHTPHNLLLVPQVYSILHHPRVEHMS